MRRLLINDRPYDVPAAVFDAFKALGNEVDLLRARVESTAALTCRRCGAVITKRDHAWVDAAGRTAHVNGRAGEAEWEPHGPVCKTDAL